MIDYLLNIDHNTWVIILSLRAMVSVALINLIIGREVDNNGRLFLFAVVAVFGIVLTLIGLIIVGWSSDIEKVKDYE